MIPSSPELNSKIKTSLLQEKSLNFQKPQNIKKTPSIHGICSIQNKIRVIHWIRKYSLRKLTKPESRMRNQSNKIVKGIRVLRFLILVIIEERKKKELTRKLQSANIIRR